MKQEIRQSILKHSGILAGFAVIIAVSVGSVKLLTEEKIAIQLQKSKLEALHEVFPSTRHNNDLLTSTLSLDSDSQQYLSIELLGLTQPGNAYIARLNDRISGIILPAEIHDAYSGDIAILVGINADGTVSGVRVLNHRETPGLGDKIDLRVSDWILGFNNSSLLNPRENQWKIKKDGGDFDQFVGATITPRAVVNGIRKTLNFFEANRSTLLGE